MGTRRFFIVNPAARTCPPDAPQRIKARFPDALVTLTRGPGDGGEIARQHLKHITSPSDVIVACGGDGTFREVAESVKSTALLGSIPMGTVNQVGGQLNIPSNFDDALAILENPFVKDVYPGLCGFDGEEPKKMFFIGVSAGPDADAVSTVNPKLKKMIGGPAYALAFLKRFLKSMDPVIRCTVTLGEVEKTLSCAQAIALSNGLYGGKFKFADDLSPTIPGIHLACSKPGRLGVTMFFLTSMGKMKFQGELLKLGNNPLTMEIPEKGHFQIDGDRIHAQKALILSATDPLRVCGGNGMAAK